MASSAGLCFFLIVLMIVGTGKASRWLENTFETHEPKRCKSIYRFLPCADTVFEGIFLILMYSYLLMEGEEWIHKGSETLVSHFGNKKAGGVIYNLLMALPRVVVVFVSGVICTQLDAQKQVDFGVAMYAGSTVFSLTGIWGAHVILLKEKLRQPTTSSTPKKDSSPEPTTSSTPNKKDSSSGCFCLKKMLSCLANEGVNLKHQVPEKARVMLLSLIPFLVVLLVQVWKSRLMILIALIVSCIFLLCSICHQVGDPYFESRSKEYVLFQIQFLEKLNELCTFEPLFDDKLQPNMDALSSVFDFFDPDGNQQITKEELGGLIDKVKVLPDNTNEDKVKVLPDNTNEEKRRKEKAKQDILWHFDINGDGKIDLEEFKKGCTRWLKEWNIAANSVLSNGQKDWYKVRSNIVTQLLLKRGASEVANLEHSMQKILWQLQYKYGIIKENGEVSDDQIKEKFRKYDTDKNDKLNGKELREAIEDLRLGYKGYEDATREDIMKKFEERKSNDISVDEIIEVIKGWIGKVQNHAKDKKVDAKLRDKKSIGEPKRRILYAVSGFVTVYLFAGPFIQSVVQFSSALHIPSLYTSFVVVPFFMNTRSMVIFALSLYELSTATTKKSASATFSELYGGLVLNNLMGLTAMLGIVYVRGLTWDYTPEVATIVVISLIMGIPAAIKSRYPLWTSILAFFLYALTVSLFCVYVWAHA